MTIEHTGSCGKVLILVSRMGGHHPVWLRELLFAFAKQGVDVILATSEERERHDLIEQSLERLGKACTLITLPSLDAKRDFRMVPKTIRKNFGLLKMYRQWYKAVSRTTKVDIVFIFYVDECRYSLGLWPGGPFGSTPWSGLVMSQIFHLADVGVELPPVPKRRWRTFLFRRLLNNPTLACLFTLDFTLKTYVDRKGWVNEDRLIHVPDVAFRSKQGISREAIRTQFQIPEDASVVLVYGALGPRKGIDVLLAALVDRSNIDSVHVMLAGKQSAPVKELLRQPDAVRLSEAGRLHTMNWYITAEEERGVFDAADIVWLGYKGHYHSSGILLQAGQAMKPVLASREGLIGYLTRHNQSGVVVDVTKPEAVADALEELVSDSSQAQTYGNNGLQAYAHHVPEHTFSLIAQNIFSRLNGAHETDTAER